MLPLVGSVKGKEGDAVTPAGNPDKLTVTIPENPFSGTNESCTCAFEFGEMETEEGFAVIVNEGGGDVLLACEPPPQPDIATRTGNRALKQAAGAQRRAIPIRQRHCGLNERVLTLKGY